jgi:hypothetical protein
MVQDNSWQLDRSINVSTILMAILMLGSFLIFASNQSSTIAVHTSQISQLEAGQRDIKAEMNARFDKLEDLIRQNQLRDKK